MLTVKMITLFYSLSLTQASRHILLLAFLPTAVVQIHSLETPQVENHWSDTAYHTNSHNSGSCVHYSSKSLVYLPAEPRVCFLFSLPFL